jgi:alpha-glucosidase
MKKFFLLTMALLSMAGLQAKEYSVASPSDNLKVTVSVDNQITYAVFFRGQELIAPSAVSMTLSDGRVLGRDARVRRANIRSVHETIKPVVPRKEAVIEDIYNLLTFSFRGYALQFRVYDDGVAYRWEINKEEPYRIMHEEATFVFPADYSTWFPEEESMYTHQERVYLRLKLSEIDASRFCSPGMLVDCGEMGKVYISESDLTDYPGMYLKGMKNSPFGLAGMYPGVVLETRQQGDRNVIPVKYADYIAEVSGSRTFPWRTLIITENDAGLVRSEMIFKLASHSELDDTDWIKPGKVAWDWWNANNIYGVDFQSGINTETYKYYIDFASQYGLEYIILDEGWYHLEDIMHVVDEIDMEELVAYGKQKNVGIILWVVWKALDDKMQEALDRFEQWGIKGIKIDFMQRDDQWMVNFYEKVARECAARKMLVDYHGAYKPAGLRRKYPNVLTYEGVRGLENVKWSNLPDPEHNVTLPFIRMVAGPMDYTPGAMLNANRTNFHPVFTEPMSPGTRCHQLAMYVVFESPLQMLADNPSNYYREPECMEFLGPVPSVWDETRVLAARVSDYIAVARRSGDTWYVGAMTDWDARTLEVDLGFLSDGDYSMQVWKDGVNASKHAADFAREQLDVTSASKIKVAMAPGGGWAAIIRKK